MNCEDFELLLAEALGDELAPGDRPRFEAHLAKCDKCRLEYETASATVATIRELPGPTGVTVRREGARLVIQDRPQRASFTARWVSSGVLRYAASILIAFAAGYGLHAGTSAPGTARPEDRTVQVDHGEADRGSAGNLQRALVSTHVRNPKRSDLAKCLIAMAKTKR